MKFLICRIQKHADIVGIKCPAISGGSFCTFLRERESAESLPENGSMPLSFAFLNLINLKLFILFTINAFKFTMKLSSVKTTMMYIYIYV